MPKMNSKDRKPGKSASNQKQEIRKESVKVLISQIRVSRMADGKCPRLSSTCKNLRVCIWNGEKSEFLGRTAASWGILFLFYSVFYAALAGLCFGFFAIFWQTIDLEQPKWQLHDSLIGTNPGIGFCPMPRESKFGSMLIWYRSSQPENMAYWYDTINKFLKDYINPRNDENIDESCSHDRPASVGKFCPFNVDLLGDCSPDRTHNDYGFPQKKPCVFLKLNKIFDWTPRVFNETNIDQLSNAEERSTYEKMPESLKIAIANATERERNIIWVSCDGQTQLDVENIGPVQYSPRRGFPAYYFPFKNVKGYQPPIVAVKFEQPKLGVIISIECKVWAKNVFFDIIEGKGAVKFKLMID